MTPEDGTVAGTVSRGSSAAQDGMEIIAWMAGHFSRPFSAAAVSARLPQGADQNDPRMLARAFDAIGLRSRLIRRSPARLDPLTLPAVLFRKSGGPLVLTELSKKAGKLTLEARGLNNLLPYSSASFVVKENTLPKIALDHVKAWLKKLLFWK